MMITSSQYGLISSTHETKSVNGDINERIIYAAICGVHKPAPLGCVGLPDSCMVGKLERVHDGVNIFYFNGKQFVYLTKLTGNSAKFGHPAHVIAETYAKRVKKIDRNYRHAL